MAAARGAAAPPAGGAQTPLAIVAFLCLAAGTQMLLALYGLLSRYVQVVSAPAMPALRLVVICNLIAEATMAALHLAPKLLLGWARQRQRQGVRGSGAAGGGAACPEVNQQQRRQLEAAACATKQLTDSSSDDAGRDGAAAEAAAAAHLPNEPPADLQHEQPTEPQQHEQPTEAQQQQHAGQPQRPRLAAARSTVRAPVPLLRGLTRRFDEWEGARPVLRRRLALAAITLSFMGTCSLQILAPGFVDVSIVQLTTQWTTLGIALAQALLLRHRLPAVFWPCAAAMLGGACMVIVPSVQRSTAGGLNSLRGWMGFLMALGAWLSTIVYYILLQATRHFGFSPLTLQHCMNVASVLLFTALSLPIDGTDWAANFAGWGAPDWLSLVALSTACYLGSGMCMQVCVWKLGAPTAAMFFGLRLVFAVCLSTPILGSTVIQTGVQIAGVVVTAVAVTCYAGSQWWASRQAQRRAAAAAAAAEGAGAGGA